MADDQNTPTVKPNPWDRIPQLPADHPLFRGGFVIGQRRSPKPAPPVPEAEPPKERGPLTPEEFAASLPPGHPFAQPAIHFVPKRKPTQPATPVPTTETPVKPTTPDA